MQAQVQKKEKSPVVFCPRCHAQNLATQSRCGKCGYVFPVKGAYKGEKKGIVNTATSSDYADSAIGAASSKSGGGMMGGAPAQSHEEEGEIQPPKLTRPKSIPEKGVSEGPMAHGSWLSCPRCGADVKADAKRCSRCGYKPA